jgi:hypothetical protein
MLIAKVLPTTLAGDPNAPLTVTTLSARRGASGHGRRFVRLLPNRMQ